MIWRNTLERYGAVAKGFHWLVALLILANLALGLYMNDLVTIKAERFRLVGLHKSIGACVLILVAARLLWRLANPRPRHLPNHKPWEITLAGITHFLLYVAMLTMPLSGWLFSSAHGVSVSVFGWFTLPDLIGKNKELGELLETYHNWTAWVLIGLIALHAAGAFKHHIIDRDETLRRMLPWGRVASLAGLTIILLLIFVVLNHAATTAANAPPTTAATSAAAPVPAAIPAGAALWQIDPAHSSLTFTATQNGAAFTGTFPGFTGTIAFDPAHLENSRAVITIPLAGVKTGSDDRDQNIGGPDWFNSAVFPSATFATTSFESKGGNSYIAHGNLTLRGVTRPVDLPCTIVITGKVAKMQGTATIKRLDFGVGGGEWSDPKSIGADVTVTVAVTATQK